MVTNLLLPKRAREKLILPSYIKLDMAFDGADDAKLYDKSRYRSHGTITGAAWATGLHGKALDFVAASKDYVEIPASHTQLNFTSEHYSIITRLKLNSLTNDETIYIRGLYKADGYWFRVGSNGDLQAYTHQSGASQQSSSPVADIVVGTWYTAGLSRNGGSVRLYKNGIDVTSMVGNHTNPATCGRSAKIGVYDDKTSIAFNGKIEFLRIFGGIALPASTHLAWHNALK